MTAWNWVRGTGRRRKMMMDGGDEKEGDVDRQRRKSRFQQGVVRCCSDEQ